jgi:hypothetical protein
LAHQFLATDDLVGPPTLMEDPHHPVVAEGVDRGFAAVS